MAWSVSSVVVILIVFQRLNFVNTPAILSSHSSTVAIIISLMIFASLSDSVDDSVVMSSGHSDSSFSHNGPLNHVSVRWCPSQPLLPKSAGFSLVLT